MNPRDYIPLFVLAKTIKPNYNYEITVQIYGAYFDVKSFQMLRLCKLFIYQYNLLIFNRLNCKLFSPLKFYYQKC